MKKTGMKRVLLLGSGYVSGPVVEYLTRDERTQVTVGEFLQTSVSICTSSGVQFTGGTGPNAALGRWCYILCL